MRFPFHELAMDKTFWSALFVAIVSSGLLTSLLTSLHNRHHDTVETQHLIEQVASESVATLNTQVIGPLKAQVDDQQSQIEHLEAQQRKYWTSVQYTRRLCHWLDGVVSDIEPDYLRSHAKPHLPDLLRVDLGDVDDGPETPGREERKEKSGCESNGSAVPTTTGDARATG